MAKRLDTSTTHEPMPLTKLSPKFSTGRKGMRRLIKRAHPRARILVIVAEECPDCSAEEGKPCHHLTIHANMHPMPLLRAAAESLVADGEDDEN